MYKDVKPYTPPVKTQIERTADALKLQDTMNNIGEGVLKFVENGKDEHGNPCTVTIEVPID